MAEGVPTNNQRGRRSGSCRIWGGLDKACHIVPTALLVRVQYFRKGLYKAVDGPSTRPRWSPRPLLQVGRDIFDFSSETAERNLTKLDSEQDLNTLYRVCVFRAGQKYKIVALASDWLRHFRLLLWNSWMEFNETWQESRSQRFVPRLCFWADLKNKFAAMASDWLRHFQFLSNPWTEFSETWRKQDLNVLYQVFVIFGPIGKLRWSPWPLVGWDIFNFSSETAERNFTKLDRKQDLNILYRVLIFRADRRKNQDGRAGLWLAETFSTSSLKPLNRIQRI